MGSDKISIKFKCVARKETENGIFVEMQPVPSVQNSKIFTGTPSGIMNIGFINPEFKFEIGAEYIFDIKKQYS